MDKAGQQYWNDTWDAPSWTFEPQQTRTRYYRDRVLAKVLANAFSGLPKGATVLEAGCADSTILPYIGRDMGFRIAGVDYSPNGCEKVRRHIERQGLSAQIECCDVFNPPESLLGKFDAICSYGLVEHFTDTAKIVQALAAFIRPGGRVLTVVPNMQGAVGLVQWLAGPSVRKIHEVLSPTALATAHSAAGLKIIEADYMLPMGFGVVNFSEPAPRALFLVRRLMIAALTRLSWLTWLVDEKVMRLPKTALLSPFSYCIAER